MIARIKELLEKGDPFCLATVVASSSPEVRPGNKAIILKDGSIEGSIGGNELDYTIRALALNALKEKKKQIVDLECEVRVFLDVLSGESRLLICGAGHIAAPLASFARMVGFRVTVLDDRSDFAHPSRFPGCDVIAQDFTKALQTMTMGASTYVVVITRGHEHDAECLAEVLRKETAYIGLIGSRRRVRFVLEMLRREGVSPERLQDVFTPIGLPIGAESPEEIALSIASELVCIRRKGPLQARSLRTATETAT